MKLKHVHISNFRSIDNIEFDCADLTIFVGKNSVGKSNVLSAIDLFFNTSDRILTEGMYCTFAEEKDEIVVELTFDNLSEHERVGRLQKYVCQTFGPGMRVRKVVERENGKLKSYYHGWLEEPKVKWLQSDFREYGKQAFWQDQKIDFFAYTSAPGGRISRELFDEFRSNYIEKHKRELEFEVRLSETEFEGLKNVGRDMLPRFELVPAVGDVSEVVIGKKTSLLNRIVSQILRSVMGNSGILMDAQEGLEAAGALINRDGPTPRLDQVGALEDWFRKEFAEWGSIDFRISTSFPGIDELLTQNLAVLVDDGSVGDIATKGHGLQRQLIYRAIKLSGALVKGEVDWVNVKDVLPEFPSIILAFEEPELYLHPQAQLAFYDDIRKLSEHDQVLLCTHSTHLVDVQDFEGVKILTRNSLNSATRICECTKDIFNDLPLKKQLALAKLFDANVNKMFFADKIILVEGHEDVIAMTEVAKKHANCFSHRVTIVNAGGKGSIPHLQRVLNAFKIPYTVVYDVDPGNDKSQSIGAKIEASIKESPWGLCSSMPMDPDLPTIVGYGDRKNQKDEACIDYLSKNAPSERFCEIVRTLYELPKAGILTPG